MSPLTPSTLPRMRQALKHVEPLVTALASLYRAPDAPPEATAGVPLHALLRTALAGRATVREGQGLLVSHDAATRLAGTLHALLANHSEQSALLAWAVVGNRLLLHVQTPRDDRLGELAIALATLELRALRGQLRETGSGIEGELPLDAILPGLRFR